MNLLFSSIYVCKKQVYQQVYLRRLSRAEMAFSSKLSSLTVTRRSISFFINFARQFRPRGVYSFGSMVSVPSTVPSLMFYFCSSTNTQRENFLPLHKARFLYTDFWSQLCQRCLRRQKCFTLSSYFFSKRNKNSFDSFTCGKMEL